MDGAVREVQAWCMVVKNVLCTRTRMYEINMNVHSSDLH